MPVIIQHNRTFLSLFGLAVNGNFHYPKYFTIPRPAPTPRFRQPSAFSRFGEMQNPKPKTLAIVAADANIRGLRPKAEGKRSEIWLEGRLRPDTAEHDRFQSDRTCGAGDQCRRGVRRLLPARQRRDGRAASEVGLQAFRRT